MASLVHDRSLGCAAGRGAGGQASADRLKDLAHIVRLVSSTGWVMPGDVASHGLRPMPCIAFQGAHGGVSRAGEQNWRVGAVLGSVGQRGVLQLVERPPIGGVTEDLGDC